MAAIDFTDRRTFLKYAAGARHGKRRGRRLAAVLALGLCAGALLAAFAPAALSGSSHSRGAGAKAAEDKEAAYRAALDKLERERAALAAGWNAARGAGEKRHVLAEASAAWSNAVVNTIIPFWYGTGYDFNGTTSVPGAGGISCGHFVATVLRDSGLRLDRIVLGQEPSETLIRSLVDVTSIRRYSNASGAEFLAACRKLAPGLYVLGLDKHVGFLSVDSSGVYFIHSTLLAPYSVVREPASSSRALMTSSYRVLGALSSDTRLLSRWLGGGKIPARE
ncbi:MAG: hypothetical protein JXD23_16690 [Spirochaetales bacterium]|nr:hypothetical protein [Spirochaetales bacterium]